MTSTMQSSDWLVCCSNKWKHQDRSELQRLETSRRRRCTAEKVRVHKKYRPSLQMFLTHFVILCFCTSPSVHPSVSSESSLPQRRRKKVMFRTILLLLGQQNTVRRKHTFVVVCFFVIYCYFKYHAINDKLVFYKNYSICLIF